MHTRLGCPIGVAAVAVFTAVAPLTGQTPYTNTFENGTPFERPDEFAGRSLEDVTGDELRTIKREEQQRGIGAFQGPIHAPDNW